MRHGILISTSSGSCWTKESAYTGREYTVGGALLATLSLIFRDQLVSDVLGPADFEFDLEILNFEFSLPAPAP